MFNTSQQGFRGKIVFLEKLTIILSTTFFAQVIPNIASARDLEFEEANKGKDYYEVGTVKMQNWITENVKVYV